MPETFKVLLVLLALQVQMELKVLLEQMVHRARRALKVIQGLPVRKVLLEQTRLCLVLRVHLVLLDLQGLKEYLAQKVFKEYLAQQARKDLKGIKAIKAILVFLEIRALKVHQVRRARKVLKALKVRLALMLLLTQFTRKF
jgi:hypothetical protein